MRLSPRLALLCVWLICTTVGCSSAGRRAHQNPAAFGRLSPADQKLVLHGRVRPGLSQEGVYLAWGEPDEKATVPASGKDGATETWVYRHRITLQQPINSYDYYGPDHGSGFWPSRPWLRPGYGVGGVGNEGLLQYQPHVRSLDTLRIAEFSAGKVDRYKMAGGAWTGASPRASAAFLTVPDRPDRPIQAGAAALRLHPAGRHPRPTTPPSRHVRRRIMAATAHYLHSGEGKHEKKSPAFSFALPMSTAHIMKICLHP